MGKAASLMQAWRKVLPLCILVIAVSGCKVQAQQAPARANPTGQPLLSNPTAIAHEEATLAASEDSSQEVTFLGPGGGGAFDVFAFSPQYVFAGTDLGGIFRSPDHGQSWQSANRGLLDYMINDMAVDQTNPDTLFAATPGGVYKSENGGDSWALLKNGFPPKDVSRYSAEIGTVALDPRNTQVIYAGVAGIRADQLARGNGDLYRSTDAGASWIKLNIGDPTAAIYKIVVDPIHDNQVYAATSHGFFLSSDSGQTWSQVDSLQSRGLAAGIDRQHSAVVLYRAAWTAGVYRSTDGGSTWQKLSKLHCPHSCRFYRIALDPSDPEARKAYVGDFGDWNQDQGIFATADGGATWRQMNAIQDGGWIGSEKATRVRALGFNPYQPGELYFGNSMGLYRSQDQSSWQPVYTAGVADAGGESVAWAGRWHARGSIDNTQANTKPMFNPSNHAEYYLGFADLYIWGTTDSGVTWENLQLPGDNDVRALIADPSDTAFLTWFASTSAQECCSGALYKTVDGGRNWLRASGLPADRILDLAISQSNPDTVYAATLSSGLYMSQDGGVTFTARNGTSGSSLPDGGLYRIAIDSQQPEMLYAAVSGPRGGVFGSDDAGETWHRSGEFADCYALAASPADPRHLFAGCGLELYTSNDGGAHWETVLHAVTPTGAGYIRDIALHPADPKIMCFVIKDDPYHDQASGGGLECTLDGGATWKEVAGPLGLLLRGTAVAFHPLANPATGDHDLFYMTGGNGAYRIPFGLLEKVMKGTG